MQENDIHVFHHLTYGNAMWRVSCYGKRQHFIWGPIGGLETIDEEFVRHYGLKERILAWTRRMYVKTLSLNQAFNLRCKCASLIICKTEATRNAIPAKYRHKTILMTDVACDDSLALRNSKQEESDITRFITVGRLDAWRGFDLVIEAFDRLARIKPDVELSIVGKGGDRTRLEHLMGRMASKSKIRMTGELSRNDYAKLVQGCDVVVNASLKEGAVTVVFDAIAYGKPLVCIETGGYTRALNNIMCECVNLSDKENLIEGLKNGMLRFCDAETRRKAAAEDSRLLPLLCWSNKGVAIRDAILENCKQ